DPEAPDGIEWGVAVASKFLAAPSVVSWAQAGRGAVATQALANVTYGPAGLGLLVDESASDVVRKLTESDEGREHRQIGVVDRMGGASTFTGSACLPWAGGRTGPGYTCQGNILTGSDVVDDMAGAFESTSGDLASRLFAALLAGDRAGGDSRGRQSAGILVVSDGGGYLGDSDVAMDLRVDDHPDPVPELGRLMGIHRQIFPKATDLEFIPIDDELAGEIAALLRAAGYEVDGDLSGALSNFVGTENLEARWRDGSVIELGVLGALRGK
ncbi:MAG: DUF1028 domain-containing protein, partial [Acidimicrobiia bacterium]